MNWVAKFISNRPFYLVDYQWLIHANKLLMFLVIGVALYLICLHGLQEIALGIRRRKNAGWHQQIIDYLVTGKKIHFPWWWRNWFNQLLVEYFRAFKGPIKRRILILFRETGGLRYAVHHLDSISESKQMTSMLLLLYSGIRLPHFAQKKIERLIREDRFSLSFIAFRLAARFPSHEFKYFIIQRVAESVSLSISAKNQVIMEMQDWLTEHYDQVFSFFEGKEDIRNFLLEAAGTFQIQSAVPTLRRYLIRNRGEAEIKSIKSLGKLGDRESWSIIMEYFHQTANPIFQTLAFKSLLAMATEEELDFVEQALHHSNWFVRLAAAKKLGRFAEKGWPILQKHADQDAASIVLLELKS